MIEVLDICATRRGGVQSHMVIYKTADAESFTELHPSIKGERGGLALCIDQIMQRHPDADRADIEQRVLLIHTMNWTRGENGAGQSYPMELS